MCTEGTPSGSPPPKTNPGCFWQKYAMRIQKKWEEKALRICARKELRLVRHRRRLIPAASDKDTQWGYRRSGRRRHWGYVHGRNSVWSATAENWSRLLLTKIRNEDTEEVGGEGTKDMCTEGTPCGPRAQVWIAISRTGFGPCSNSNDDDPTMRRPHKTLSLSLLDKSLRESSSSTTAATAWRKP
jgi:hypothetical protein